MPFISDNALDAKLNYIRSNGTLIHVCTSEPSNYAGVAGVSLGSVAVVIAAPADGPSNGRKVEVDQFTVNATGSDTGTHYAVVSGSELLAAGGLSAGVVMTSSVDYTFSAFDILAPDAT